MAARECRRPTALHGTTRSTLRGDADNGFGYTFNWNRLGDGSHNLRAFADGVEFANVNFTVTTLGVEYLQGVSGEFILSNFPATGNDIAVRWSEPHQNFVIVGANQNPTDPLPGHDRSDGIFRQFGEPDARFLRERDRPDPGLGPPGGRGGNSDRWRRAGAGGLRYHAGRHGRSLRRRRQRVWLHLQLEPVGRR